MAEDNIYINKKKALLTAKRLAQQRKRAQQLLLNYEPLQEKFSAIGLNENGITESGEIKKTKPPNAFGIKIEERKLKNGKPYPKRVIMKFKRENVQAIKSLGFSEVEIKLKKGWNIPKKQVVIVTDIFRAVRLCKHLREGYDAEIKKKNCMLKELEKINAEMNELQIRGNVKKEELAFFLSQLSSYYETSKRWKSSTKLLAKKYFEDALTYLKDGMETNEGHRRNILLIGACAKLTAFRNRFGYWRDKSIGKLQAWNSLRECSLRAKRDGYLKSLVEDYIRLLQNTKLAFAALRIWRNDLWFLGHLAIIKEAIEQKKKYGEIRILLKSFYYDAKNTNIKDDVVLIAKLLQSSYDIALQKIELLEIFLQSTNPWYVATQLEKTTDSYLAKFEELFNKSLERLENNDIWRAKNLLQNALLQLK